MRCASSTAPTPCGSMRCSPDRSIRAVRGRPRPSSACTACCSGSGARLIDEETGAAPGRRPAGRRRDTTHPASHDRVRPRRDGDAAVQHLDRPDHRAEQPPDRARHRTTVPREVAEPLVLLLAPLAPHMAEELWSRMGHDRSLAWEPFPTADPAWLVQETVEIAGPGERQAPSPHSCVARHRRGGPRSRSTSRSRRWPGSWTAQTVQRVIVVPGRLVNFVLALRRSHSGAHAPVAATVSPLRWGYSSVGRALPWHGRGQGFDSP